MTEISPLRSTSSAVADYAKAIFALQQLNDGKAVSTTALAVRLNVTAGSVSGMLKRLEAEGFIAREPYYGVSLTTRGEQVALELLRHHRLLELYLVEHLGISSHQAHSEAELLEHVISEELEQKIAEKLGDPTHDPHGSPIPSEQLQLRDGYDNIRLAENFKERENSPITFFTHILDKTQTFYENVLLANCKVAQNDLWVAIHDCLTNKKLNLRFTKTNTQQAVSGVKLSVAVQDLERLRIEASTLGYQLKENQEAKKQRISYELQDPNGVLLEISQLGN